MDKVDWFAIISDLKKQGISGREIARRLGISSSTVITWKQGASPRYEKGVQLLEIWEASRK